MFVLNGNIKNYLNSVAGNLPPEIVSEATYRQIYQTAALFSDFAASEYIMETHLNTEAAEVDFSFRVLTQEKTCLTSGLKNNFSTLAVEGIWRKIADFVNFWPSTIGDIWFEMDYGEYEKPIPQPCFFFNASQIKKGTEVQEQLLFNALKQLMDMEQLELLWPNLQGVTNQLPPEAGLFQVGVMLARNNDRVRIFTAELTREQVTEYLSAIGWQGPFSRLTELFELVHSLSDGQYIVDFDVTREGVSGKIGINFGLQTKKMLPYFLEKLVTHRLCTDTKRKGILAWPGSQGSFLGPDYGYTALIKNISHFKIGCSPEEDFKAKAYLRVEGIYLKELFKVNASRQFPDVQPETKREQPCYKEIQNVLKQIAQRSMLDQEFRELCLRDGQAAVQAVSGNDRAIPDILFVEEDQKKPADDGLVYILPPFLKPSWLTSK